MEKEKQESSNRIGEAKAPYRVEAWRNLLQAPHHHKQKSLGPSVTNQNLPRSLHHQSKSPRFQDGTYHKMERTTTNQNRPGSQMDLHVPAGLALSLANRHNMHHHQSKSPRFQDGNPQTAEPHQTYRLLRNRYYRDLQFTKPQKANPYRQQHHRHHIQRESPGFPKSNNVQPHHLCHLHPPPEPMPKSPGQLTPEVRQVSAKKSTGLDSISFLPSLSKVLQPAIRSNRHYRILPH